MSIVHQGRRLETSASGRLLNAVDWSRDLAEDLARREGFDLAPRHWDVIAYLRDEFFNNSERRPDLREIVRAMTAKWEEKTSAEAFAELFPGGASQAAKIAGLPD